MIHHGLVRWESRMAFACPHGSSGSSTVSLLISVILAPFSGMYSHEVGGKKKKGFVEVGYGRMCLELAYYKPRRSNE